MYIARNFSQILDTLSIVDYTYDELQKNFD